MEDLLEREQCCNDCASGNENAKSLRLHIDQHAFQCNAISKDPNHIHVISAN